MDANKLKFKLKEKERVAVKVETTVIVAEDVYAIIDELDHKDNWSVYESGKAHGYKEAIKDMKELLGK